MNIIFDLDGTLIDSSSGILHAISIAFERCDVQLKQELTPTLIGPPLTELLPLLAGTTEIGIIEHLSTAFKECYDDEGFKESEVFNGVDKMLVVLNDAGHQVYLATNKRIIPTRKIITYFGWEHLFDGIYALDSFNGLPNKQALISHIILLHDMDKQNTLYIGDTLADHRASSANNIAYVMAMWGYDSADFEGVNAHSPLAVTELIDHIK